MCYFPAQTIELVRPRVSLAFGADDRLITMDCISRRLRILNVKTNEVGRSFMIPCSERELMLGMHLSNDRSAVVLFSQMHISCYALSDLRLKFSIPVKTSSVCTHLAVSPDDKVLFASFRPLNGLFSLFPEKRPELCAYSFQNGELLAARSLNPNDVVDDVFLGAGSDILVKTNQKTLTQYELTHIPK